EIEAKAYAKSVANGMTVYQPTEPEMAAWKAVSQPVYDTFLKVNGAAGKAMLDAARAF
ncbi:MAG: C4-dicarboxylate-binding protein DctP, partial [Paracoccaceae bacterium]